MRLNRCLNLDIDLFFDNCAALVITLAVTRTDSPSSGLGQLTEEKWGSGSLCSGTAMGGGNPNARNACCTYGCPTPWKDEWTNLRGDFLFRSLEDIREIYTLLMFWHHFCQLTLYTQSRPVSIQPIYLLIGLFSAC